MKSNYEILRDGYMVTKQLTKYQKQELSHIILSYLILGEEPEVTPLIHAIFNIMRPNLDKVKKRHCTGVESGKKVADLNWRAKNERKFFND